MLSKREHTRLKGRLTRALKEGPAAVIAEVEYAFSIFDAVGYPDTWHTWNIAKSDAQVALAIASW